MRFVNNSASSHNIDSIKFNVGSLEVSQSPTAFSLAAGDYYDFTFAGTSMTPFTVSSVQSKYGSGAYHSYYPSSQDVTKYSTVDSDNRVTLEFTWSNPDAKGLDLEDDENDSRELEY